MGFSLAIKKFIKRVVYTLYRLQENVDDAKVLQGKILAELNKSRFHLFKENIQQAEFKAFSQWGDDGIIEFLVFYLDISEKSFIEFGVEDYTESNTRFLLINHNWRGLVLDGNRKDIDYILDDEITWRHALIAKHAFITKENINQLIKENGFSGELGLLHIDIDGNDYWVWDAIDVVNPVIVIVEYNSVFGKDRAITIPYNPGFNRTNAHYSNLYFGASLKSLVTLGAKKGYSFIGSNSHGNNAYFVRNDKVKDLKVRSIEEGYVESKFREGRLQNGRHSYLAGKDRLAVLKGLPVVNVETGASETL
jgi:hypothetical protein